MARTKKTPEVARGGLGAGKAPKARKATTPVKTTPRKATPVKATPVKSTPVKGKKPAGGPSRQPAKPKRRTRPGIAALREIRKYQKGTVEGTCHATWALPQWRACRCAIGAEPYRLACRDACSF